MNCGYVGSRNIFFFRTIHKLQQIPFMYIVRSSIIINTISLYVPFTLAMSHTKQAHIHRHTTHHRSATIDKKKKWINIISMLKQIARHFVGKRWTIIQFTVSDVCACQNFLCSSVSVGQNLFRTITENLSQKASNYSFVFCIFFVFC